jgi:hypothetical protein
MKPLNLDNSPCNPISSNCIVWQGPDITCINLCTGDNVSDVVSKLATELCTIMETLKITNYDLSCFDLTACGPADFQALIQLLIDKICTLEGVTPEQVKSTDTCPDCVVSVAECFITGTQTTMQLVDYVNLIGERICSIITDISLINTQIADILVRITNLEATPEPTLTLPSFTLSCQIGSLLSGSTQQIDILLEEFINNVWCGYVTATGSGLELTTAVGQKCIIDGDTQLNTGTPFSANPLWIQDASYATVADAINNLWIALCDVYNYTTSSVGVTVLDTNTVDLNITVGNLLSAKVKDTGWVDLEGFDFYSGSAIKPQVRRIGNVLHFRGYIFVPLSDGGGGIQALGSFSDYNSIPRCNPATGAGGVTISVGGVISFNGGLSVIPTSVTTDTFDGDYRMPYPGVLSRPIIVTGAYGTVLNAACRIGITSAGVLFIGALRDQEEISGAPGFVGGSHLRFITSNVRSGESIPNYINTASYIHNFPAAGVNALVAETDFSGADYTWPFDCDAGDSSDLGGFFATIEGLTAFLDCDADIVETTCY